MLFALTFSLFAGAGPALASPDFTTLNVKEDVARFCNEHLAQQLASRGVQVTTARQISAMLGLERQKQLLGCGEDSSSCMAELAAALGVDGVLLGDLGRLGTKFQVNLRVLRSTNGEVLATWSRSVPTEDDLLEALTEAARELTPKIQAVFGKQAPAGATPVTTPAPRVDRTWPLAPTFIAGGLAVVSAVGFGLAAGAHARLVDLTLAPGSISDPNGLAEQGRVTQGLGIGAAIGAGVALGVNVLLWALSGHQAPLQAALGPWRASLQQVRR